MSIQCQLCSDKLVGKYSEKLEPMRIGAWKGCGHTGHIDCFLRSLKHQKGLHSTCPICRVASFSCESKLPKAHRCKGNGACDPVQELFLDIDDDIEDRLLIEIPVGAATKRLLDLADLAEKVGEDLQDVKEQVEADIELFREEMNVGERSVDVDFLRPIEDRLKKLSVRLQKTAAIKSVGECTAKLARAVDAFRLYLVKESETDDNGLQLALEESRHNETKKLLQESKSREARLLKRNKAVELDLKRKTDELEEEANDHAETKECAESRVVELVLAKAKLRLSERIRGLQTSISKRRDIVQDELVAKEVELARAIVAQRSSVLKIESVAQRDTLQDELAAKTKELIIAQGSFQRLLVLQRDTLQRELAAEREELERVQMELKREQVEPAEDVARHRSGKRKRSESPILLAWQQAVPNRP